MVAPDQGCKLPPEGWYCSREPGHDGPCAAGKSSLGQDWVSRMTSATAPDMTTPSSDTPEMSELLNDFQAALLVWAESAPSGFRTPGSEIAAARQAIESAFSKLREENEQIRKFEHDAATDLSGTWEEVRRLRSSSLTPEEAKLLAGVLEALPGKRDISPELTVLWKRLRLA